MGKPKKRKYIAKPKAIKMAGYFNKDEVQLIDFVATKLLKVSRTQFIKGACVEMAQAALNMAQEKANAEQGEGTTDSTDESGVKQSSIEGGEAAAIPEPSGTSTEEAAIS